MEELNFITALSLVLEIIAVLVITYKIEKKQLNKKILVKGFLLAVIMVFFSYFVQLTFSRTFPLMSSFFIIFILLLMVYILFNRYYENKFITAVIKTGITFLIIPEAVLKNIKNISNALNINDSCLLCFSPNR